MVRSSGRVIALGRPHLPSAARARSARIGRAVPQVSPPACGERSVRRMTDAELFQPTSATSRSPTRATSTSWSRTSRSRSGRRVRRDRRPVRLRLEVVHEARDGLEGPDAKADRRRRPSRRRAAQDRRHGVPGADAARGARRSTTIMPPLEIVEPFARRSSATASSSPSARALRRPSGLDGYEDKFPYQLSGMQQRASICRASSTTAGMLLLDEPFRGARRVHARAVACCATSGPAALHRHPVTHDLREAVFLADTVYVMRSGPAASSARREIDLRARATSEVTYPTTSPTSCTDARAHRKSASA